MRRDARRYRVAPAVSPVRHAVRPAAPAVVTTIADRDAVPADPAGLPSRPDSPPAPLPTRSGPADAWAANEVTTAGGPLIAPAAPTSTIARRQPGRWADLAVADAFPSRPAPGTEIDDDDARLDELVDAVAARLADQLAMTSDDLGIEV